MEEKSDEQLLREYGENGSEMAFAELVLRYTNLVYSAARRMVTSHDLSRDVAQSVFTDLARKATSIADKLEVTSTLVGWLYQSTRFAALALLRTDRRRQERERQAMQQIIPEPLDLTESEQISGVLDEAMASLSDEDRNVLLWRYFNNQNLRSIGCALGSSEDAAQKRVSRALEKLRLYLGRSGITTGGATLSAILSTIAVQTAPAGIAAVLASSSLAGAALPGTMTFLLKLMTTIKIKMIGISALVAAAIIVPVWQESRIRSLQERNHESLSSGADSGGSLRTTGQARVDELERLRASEKALKAKVLELRGRAGSAQRAKLENDDLKLSLARQAPVVEAVTNAINKGLELANEAERKQMAEKVARMKLKLNLNESQEQVIMDLLLISKDAEAEITRKLTEGKIDMQEAWRAHASLGKPDEFLLKVLDSKQQAAFKEFQFEEADRGARSSAENDVQHFKSSFGLSAEQQTKAFQALYDVQFENLHRNQPPPMPTTGDVTTEVTRQMTEAMDRQLKALEGILTAEQLDQIRREKMGRMESVIRFLPKKAAALGPK